MKTVLKTTFFLMLFFLTRTIGAQNSQFAPTGAIWYYETTSVVSRVARDLPEQLWTDIVTEQPDGYVVDENGDVHIYTAEAMAWVSVLSNGLHGQEVDDFEGRTISLENDVAMSRATWIPISGKNDVPSFKGTFKGNGHTIDGVQLTWCDGFDKLGFFGYLFEATLSNVVIRNGYFYYFDSYYIPVGFLATQVEKSLIDRCFVECEMHGGYNVPFVYSNSGSTITNSMVHCPMLENLNGHNSGAFVAENRIYNGDETLPVIQNCAAIIEKIEFTYSELYGFVGEYNHGLIENCYVFIGEMMNYPGCSGNGGHRNGITKDNMGEVHNCYYNRIRNYDPSFTGYYMQLDDSPGGGGGFYNTSPFVEEGRGHWKLVNSIGFELENGTVTTDDLLEALNFKVELLSNPELLDWCDVAIGFDNQQLPVFCGINVAETDEHQTINNPIVLSPNPSTGVFTVTGENLKRIEVFDILGQKVTSLQVNGDQTAIDLSGHPAGVYLINVTDKEGKLCVKKVVKH